jgi:hypothetical protein
VLGVVRHWSYARSLDIAESRSPDFQIRVDLQGYISDLGPYVFSLPIAVGPNEERSTVTSFGLYVLGDAFFVLQIILVYNACSHGVFLT